MAVKLVVEPIFEADFEDCSYGFRPKREAHQAVDAIRSSLYTAHPYVFDADLREYFDTIPHDRLLQRVARRVSDRHILRMIKQWLKAPIVEEDEGGKRRTAGGKGSRRGTPQGGVISPLLANIYLHRLDKQFVAYCRGTGVAAQLVRYADDFVILMRGKVEPTLQQVQRILGGMELELNREKSRVVDAREEGFDFLGFTFKRAKSNEKGKGITLVEPSRKSAQHFRDEIRRLTSRKPTVCRWNKCFEK